MKTIQLKFKTLFLLLLIGFSFASCSKDDPEPENQAPNSFALNEISNGVNLLPQLTWETATDPEGDDVSYQVYLDTNNPPRITIANDLGLSSFKLENELVPETTYYWKVVAKDSKGNTSESDIVSFTTRDKTTAESLVGKWFYESVEGESPLTACEQKNFYLFTEDFVLQAKGYREDSNGDCIEIGNDNTTYELIGDQIEIEPISGNITLVLKIKSLTEKELVVKYEDDKLITFKKE